MSVLLVLVLVHVLVLVLVLVLMEPVLVRVPMVPLVLGCWCGSLAGTPGVPPGVPGVPPGVPLARGAPWRALGVLHHAEPVRLVRLARLEVVLQLRQALAHHLMKGKGR